jgi:hypothetical protein
MLAWLIEKNKIKYIAFADTLDNAIKSLNIGFENTSSQRYPVLDSLQVLKVNKKSIRVIFKGKEHVLTPAKDMPSTIISARVTKLDNGQEWFSYGSLIQDTLEKIGGYRYSIDLINALYNGIKAS